jgi:rod shape-determining protein MreD
VKRTVLPILSLMVACAIQGNLPRFVTLFGAKPNLVLVVLIAYSLASEPGFGAALGFVAGLIEGSAVGLSTGSFIVTRTITGFLAGLVTTRLFSDNPIVPVVSAAWLTLVCEVLFLLANPLASVSAAGMIILGECILNAFMTFILHFILRQFEARRKMRLVNARL